MSTPVETHEDQELAQAVHELVLEDYKGPGKPEFESRERYVWLRELGSRLWIDSGDAEAVEKVWSRELEALTTNNTLVNQIVSGGVMDGVIAFASRRIRDLRPDISDSDLIKEVGFVVNAKLALSLVERFGAHVSVELHPDVGFDVARTLSYARRYYRINPDHFYIKVPMTPDGFVAARILSSEGIPVNYTLGFSARQNYLAARFSRPRFVNVFLGRLNQLVEENGVGRPENVGEKAALASDEAIADLERMNPDLPTRQIAASMRSGQQVVTLAGMDVLTIPPKAAGDYLEMVIAREDVRRQVAGELHVEIDPEKAGEFAKLWEIGGRFVEFVERALKRADEIASGKDLVELSRRQGVDLFHDWSAEDRLAIRRKGKIPELARWPGAPIDDLMSISALESFAKDQADLDARIARLIHEG